jgi:hypothetical protein
MSAILLVAKMEIVVSKEIERPSVSQGNGLMKRKKDSIAGSSPLLICKIRRSLSILVKVLVGWNIHSWPLVYAIILEDVK